MGWSAEAKHVLHVISFVAWIVLFEIVTGALPIFFPPPAPFDPLERYGYVGTIFLYFLRFASLLVLPQCVCNMFGLVMYNGFREKVHLKASPLLAPLVCFRVVTKGDYPELVKNIDSNLAMLDAVGVANFIIEVVTDAAIHLPTHQRVREIVVPLGYKTKCGALFKSRALQYCLEDDVNILHDDDWIVHLDEETLLTENAVCGILNFCDDGRYPFGQGVITYASGEIVNWVTTLADTFRVADDYGKLRFQLQACHKPLFGWKGSFVVTQVSAERAVTFDHGRDGSIAEDCYFSMIAYRDGYSFNFIEGQMHEKSPFTVWDCLQQRKRWLQGIFLTVHSEKIPIRYKALLALSLYAWATMPLTSTQVVLCALLPLPRFLMLDFLVAYVGAVNLYMYMFGALKSFAHKCQQTPCLLLPYTIGALLTIPFNICIENVAVVWGLCTKMHDFYVVEKRVSSSATPVDTARRPLPLNGWRQLGGWVVRRIAGPLAAVLRGAVRRLHRRLQHHHYQSVPHGGVVQPSVEVA